MTEPHRKQLRRFEQVVHLHELTFSCFHRKPLLTTTERLTILSNSLKGACVQEQFQLIAFVFMPEHVHLLVLPENNLARIGRLLARIKQPTSSQTQRILDEEERDEFMVQERPDKRCFRMWQAGAGYDRNLVTPEAVSSSIDYIHLNPVKRGLCDRAADFKWSSARFHLHNVIDPDLPRLTLPDPEWLHQSGTRSEFA